MRRLKTQHQFAISFSLFFFLFLSCFSLLIYFLFRVVLQHQVKKDLDHEISEITENHLVLEGGSVQFFKDKTGESLRQHLFTDGISAIFYDINGFTLRSYGIFEPRGENTNDNLIELEKEMKLASSSGEVREVSSIWKEVPILSFIVPLKTKEAVIGTMIVSKPLTLLDQIMSSMVVVLASLGFVGLLGSFILGYFLAHEVFRSVRKIRKVVEDIDLEKMDTLVDITGHPDDELVRLSNKFNDMILRLREMTKRQKEFVSNASHELRTPLTRAISSLDLVITRNTQDKEELRLVKQDLLDINTLIEQLLLLSRIRDTHDVPSGSADVSRAVGKVLIYFSHEIESRFIGVSLNVEENIKVHVPEEYAEIILKNIISNALRYSKDHTSISILCYAKEPYILLEVTDQGVGMSEEETRKIFYRFYRGKQTELMYKGHGIGLSLVKEICDLYRIKIQVHSEKEHGTTVKLIF